MKNKIQFILLVSALIIVTLSISAIIFSKKIHEDDSVVNDATIKSIKIEGSEVILRDEPIDFILYEEKERLDFDIETTNPLSKIEISGNRDLNNDFEKNEIKIKITTPNKTEKVYTVNVYLKPLQKSLGLSECEETSGNICTNTFEMNGEEVKFSLEAILKSGADSKAMDAYKVVMKVNDKAFLEKDINLSYGEIKVIYTLGDYFVFVYNYAEHQTRNDSLAVVDKNGNLVADLYEFNETTPGMVLDYYTMLQDEEGIHFEATRISGTDQVVYGENTMVLCEQNSSFIVAEKYRLYLLNGEFQSSLESRINRTTYAKENDLCYALDGQ